MLMATKKIWWEQQFRKIKKSDTKELYKYTSKCIKHTDFIDVSVVEYNILDDIFFGLGILLENDNIQNFLANITSICFKINKTDYFSLTNTNNNLLFLLCSRKNLIKDLDQKFKLITLSKLFFYPQNPILKMITSDTFKLVINLKKPTTVTLVTQQLNLTDIYYRQRLLVADPKNFKLVMDLDKASQILKKIGYNKFYKVLYDMEYVNCSAKNYTFKSCNEIKFSVNKTVTELFICMQNKFYDISKITFKGDNADDVYQDAYFPVSKVINCLKEAFKNDHMPKIVASYMFDSMTLKSNDFLFSVDNCKTAIINFAKSYTIINLTVLSFIPAVCEFKAVVEKQVPAQTDYVTDRPSPIEISYLEQERICGRYYKNYSYVYDILAPLTTCQL